jgi:4-hydroxythreonine-4-phosphate dehydrogenase
MNKRVCISSGDYNGIGPEVILKTLQEYPLEGITPIILSSSEVIEYYTDLFSWNIEYNHTRTIANVVDGKINLLESYGDKQSSVEPGAFTKQSGKCSMLAVERGLQLCKTDQADALVTAPISKEAVNLAGYNIPGHTEFLAEHTGTDDFMMILVHDQLRVGLATVHIPVAEISQQLSEAGIRKYIGIMQRTLQSVPHIYL